MKILWLCNLPTGRVAEAAGLKKEVFGGWLEGMSEALLSEGEIELVYCFATHGKSVHGKSGCLSYYGFGEDGQQECFKKILQDERPELIHIFGTEFTHSLNMIKAAKELGLLDKTAVSIQGLVSVYAEHFYAFLPEKVIHAYSLRDLLKRDNIRAQRGKFIRRGLDERETLRLARHAIGRTDWDRACVKRINPDIEYHFCNETLRPAFYENRWTLNGCERHAIFVSQAGYPLKGFHLMLEAMREIVKSYPDAVVYVTESDILRRGFKEKLKETYYPKYLRGLIIKYGLEKNVCFTGRMNEREMCGRFMRSHIFVCCSSIENSPNSVGEAMLLGVPTVSADVGGVKNMMTHGEDGFLYQADAPYMLAHYVMEIFEDDALAQRFSENARAHASVTHNRDINRDRLKEIYREIANK